MKAILVFVCFFVCVFSINIPQIQVSANDEAPAINYGLIDYVNGVQSTWKAGHNKRFEGLTVRDIKRLCGVPLVVDEADKSPVKVFDSVIALPDSFDAREQWPQCASIGSIRDQGHCGSCWAFGAAEALTDRLCIQSKGQVKIALSTQDLTSCDTSNLGCNGGNLAPAWRYMLNTGIVSEDCYPYQMGTCKHPGCSELPTPKCNQTCKNSATFSADKHHAATEYAIARDEAQIRQEIYTNGPVEAAFTVYQDFNNYQSGVYHHVSGSAEGGHAIKIIGWGTEANTPYWLVANSWNTDWGDKGFFKIRRGTNECGIEGNIVAGLAKV